jgi:hypothetical protein
VKCRRRQERDPGDLDDGHQRHRGEVQHQTGERGLAEGVRRYRAYRGLRRERGAGKQPHLIAEPRHGSWHAGRQETREPAREGRRLQQDADRGEHRQPEADVDHRERRRHDQEDHGDGNGVGRGRAQVQRPRTQVDGRRQGGAGDRRAAHDRRGVEPEHGEHSHRARPWRHAEAPDDAENDRREHGDVAARDRQHVVGAGALQPRLDVGREAGAIAYQHGEDDRGRLWIARTDGRGDGPACPGPRRRRRFVEPMPPRQDLDQCGALHRAEHADAAPGQPHLLVGRAEVAVREGSAQGGGRPNPSAGAPGVACDRRLDAGDGQADATGHRPPSPGPLDAPGVQRAGDAEVRRYGVVAQDAFDDHRILAGQRRQAGRQCRPRRPRPERGASDRPEEARDHCAAAHAPPHRGARDACRCGKAARERPPRRRLQTQVHAD